MAINISDATKGVLVGVDKVHWAKLVRDEESIVQYDNPISLENARSMSVSGNATLSSFYGDNKPVIISKGEGEHAIAFEKADLGIEEQAIILGHSIDNVGGIIASSTDTPPYGAIGGRMTKSNGAYRLFWCFKGIFVEPDLKVQTNEGTPNFQPATINGTFIDRKADGAWRYMIDTDSENYTEAFGNSFFTKGFLETLVNINTVYTQPAEFKVVDTKPTASNAKPGVIYYVSTGADLGKAFYTTGTAIKEITPIA